MATVAVVSDTHCYHDPAETVPDWVRERVETADHTIHAGDVVTPDALAFFESRARDLVAVRGNGDVAGVDLPTVASLSVEGVTVGITHPPGVGDVSPDATAYGRTVVQTLRERVGPVAVAVAGHTHRVLDTVVDGTRLLNPGSATGALPASDPSMLVLDVHAGEFDVTVLDRGSQLDP